MNDKGRYLLVLGKKCRKWGFPKGHLYENESLKQGAIREMYEETGLRVSIPEDICHQKFGHTFYFRIGMDCIRGNTQPQIKDKKEILKAKWFHYDEMKSLERWQVTRDVWTFLGKKSQRVVSKSLKRHKVHRDKNGVWIVRN